MVTLYNVISSDGFIAEKDGSEDFIPEELWSYTLKVLREFDVFVMGRKSYEALQSYPAHLRESLEALPLTKIVLSRNTDVPLKSGYTYALSPESALSTGSRILVSSGPMLNNYLFEKNLIGEVVVHKLPVELKEGIPWFDSRYSKLLSVQSEKDIGLAKEFRYSVNTNEKMIV